MELSQKLSVASSGEGARYVKDVKYHESNFSASSQYKPAGGGNGIPGSVFNLLNTVLGGGMMSIHGVSNDIGYFPMVAFTLFIATLSCICLRLLASAALMSSQRSMESISVAAFGPVFARGFTGMCIVIQLCGPLIYYCFLAVGNANVLNQVLGIDWSGGYYALAIAAFILVPLCSLRDISFLSPVSFLALFALFCLSMAAAAAHFGLIDNLYSESEFRTKGIDNTPLFWPVKAITFHAFFTGRLGIIIYGFSCHSPYLNIAAELRYPTLSNMTKVAVGAIVIASCFYLWIASFGTFAFGQAATGNINDDIRNCYYPCSEDVWALSGGECVAKGFPEPAKLCKNNGLVVYTLTVMSLFAIILGYPLVHFAQRISLISVVFGPYMEFSWALHLGIMALNVSASVLIAVFYGGQVLGVFGACGGIVSPLVSYALPGLLYARVSTIAGVPWSNPRVIGALCIFVFGVGFALCGTIVIFM